jgi:hypothetical protein
MLIGEQAELDEFVSGLAQIGPGHGQALAQRVLGVVAQPLSVGHGEQEKREGTGLMAEVIDIALTDQSLIDPAELAGWAPEFVGQDEMFVHRQCLLVKEVNR